MASIAEQLVAWSKDRSVSPALGAERSEVREPAPIRVDLPKSLADAEMRRREIRLTIADIDAQLACKDRRRFHSDSDFDTWQTRASSARRSYEMDLARADAHIAVFREEAAGAAACQQDPNLDIAKEQCRNLAAEVERQSLIIAELRSDNQGASANRAFVEVARVVLGEVTFNRIMARARERKT